MTEHVYMCLLKLYQKYQDQGLRGRILQCLGKLTPDDDDLQSHLIIATMLGFLFRAQPALMTAEPSAKIMDDIFTSPIEDIRGRLLKILQDFLVAEAAKHAANEKGGVHPSNHVLCLTHSPHQPPSERRARHRQATSTWRS